MGVWRKHDAGVFSLEIPAEWALTVSESGTVLVLDQTEELALTVAAISKQAGQRLVSSTRGVTGREAQGELQKFLETQGHIEVKHPPRVVGGMRHVTATTEGVERAAKRLRWWEFYKRFWRREAGTFWRFWAVVNPHLLLLASSSGTAEGMEKRRGVLDRVMGSMRLPEVDLLLGRPFADKVASLARSYFPELMVAVIDEGHLRCGSRPVSLMPLHQRYLASPADLPIHVKSFFMEVQGEMPASEMAKEWVSARRHVLPTFVKTEAAGGLAHQPWVNGLSIGYLLEEEGEDSDSGGDRAVMAADVKRWGIDEESLHEQALKNLVGKSHEHAMEVHRSEGYTMMLLAAAERHNAVRLLLPELHSILREHLGTTFYAAIPTGEFLLAFSTVNAEILGRVREQVAADYGRAKKGISPKIFLVTADGIAGDPGEEEDFE